MSVSETVQKNKATFIGLAILVVLFVVALIVVIVLQNNDSGELKAYVHDGDGNVTELDLSTDSTTMIVTSLGVNTVVVENRVVRITDANCPNQDCVRQRAITQPGEQLICLPHKLWVTIATSAEGNMNTAEASPEEGDVQTGVSQKESSLNQSSNENSASDASGSESSNNISEKSSESESDVHDILDSIAR